MDLLKQKLSDQLNKPVSDNLVMTLQLLIQKNPDMGKFQAYCKVIGFPSDEFAAEVYEDLNRMGTSVGKRSKEQSKAKKGGKVAISFDDDLDDVPVKKPKKAAVFKKIKKEQAMKFKYGEELVENGPVSGVDGKDMEVSTGSGFPEPIKSFKKESMQTNGQDIIQPSKQESDGSDYQDQSSIGKENRHIASLEELAQQEEEDAFHQEVFFDQGDVQNDMEWYMGDEYEEEIPEEPVKKPKFKPKIRHNQTGGKFNENGEYIDHDHEPDEEEDLNNTNISSHFFVPPFLKDSTEALTIQLNEGLANFIKGISSNFSPVKNPNSHLAIMAREGSQVVNELRSNKQKKSQAKERAGLNGSNMANVLGIEDEIEKEKQPEEAVEPNTQIDHISIKAQRKSLPVYLVRSKLLQVIADNQVVIIIGETGSGKTTQLTQYLYEEGYGKCIDKDGIKRQIGCTQPRRVAAMSVAQRVSEEMGCKLGDEVGYAIRFEDKTCHNKTIIKYLTDGILLRELLMDPNLDSYSCVIMDEAHERSLNTDILLGLLRQLIMKRKDLKLIVTSATMNAEKFTNFFGNAPQFTIPGRTFPVEVFYNRLVSDYVDSTVKQIITIHLENLNENYESDGDILVFLTGQEDIEACCELVKLKLEELGDVTPLDIYPIYSTLPSDTQKKIFRKSNKLRRKVVVATNIAETSLTVDGVRYVIDCGLVKMKIYNPKLGMDTLKIIPISQANAGQRSGRAGRTAPGKAYRLYSEKEMHEDLLSMPIPEIQRTNLNNIMLLLKSLKVNKVSDFPFMDAPPNDILACSLYDLWSIGALDNLGSLTNMGRRMIDFPIEPSLSKLIILASEPRFHCSFEILVIVSMLSVPNVFVRPKERSNEADMAREKFSVEQSDHLTLLNIYQQWELQLKKPNMNLLRINSWCSKNFLNNKSLLRARDIKNQLLLIMKKNSLPIVKSNNDETVKKCICACFFNQLAKLSKLNLTNSNQIEYLNLRHNFMKLYLHPISCLNNSTTLPPTYVVYHELIMTTKEYMNCVTAVNPLWLLEFGYIFYEISPFDKAKLSKFDLGFNIVDKELFNRILQDDEQRYMEIDLVKKIQKKEQPIIKKFKLRRGI